MNPISSTSSYKAIPTGNPLAAVGQSTGAPSAGTAVNSASSSAKPLQGESYDFGKLLQESSQEAKIEKEHKEKNAQGKDLLNQITEKKVQADLKSKHKKELDKDDFLKLFIAQIEAQDPTKPMDNIQLAEQMAQFNSLEQLMHVDKGIQDLAKNMQASNLNTIVNYIGKSIEMDGGKLNLTDIGTVKAGFNLAEDAETTNIVIRDRDGKEVNQLPLGQKSHGAQSFEWNGKLKDGSKALPGVYTYEVQAADTASKPINALIKTEAEIKGVKMQGNIPVLMTDFGNVQTNEVQAIRVKDTANAALSKGNTLENAPNAKEPAKGLKINKTTPEQASQPPMNDLLKQAMLKIKNKNEEDLQNNQQLIDTEESSTQTPPKKESDDNTYKASDYDVGVNNFG